MFDSLDFVRNFFFQAVCHCFIKTHSDRDESRMKRIPEEFEKRRTIFWDLLDLDCHMVMEF